MKTYKGLNTLTIEEKNTLIHAFCQHITLCLEVDIRNRTFRKIMSDLVNQEVFDSAKTTDDILEIFFSELAQDEDKVMLNEFFDLSNVQERLKRHTFLQIQFCMKNNEWRQAIFMKSKQDKKGQLTHVLFTIGLIDQEELDLLTYKREMERKFYSSLMTQSFKLFLQPKFDRDEKIIGAEALVRWQNKDGSFEMPDRFIEEFEREGLIEYLDEYMFERVCEFQAERVHNHLSFVPISVNISRATLCVEDCLSKYLNIAMKYEVPLNLVPLEITESAFVKNTELIPVIQSFKSAGFSLHIDDFGNGYSTISNLFEFNVDVIKFDKSIIDQIGNEFCNSLLSHMVNFAHKFNLEIVAEGVENKEQVEFLNSIGCDYIQGFYYGKPVCIDEFKKRI